MPTGTYIAAATASNPVVLFRALGGADFSTVHTNSLARGALAVGGFTAIHGLTSGDFVVAVGADVYKLYASEQCITGCMSVYADGVWSEITVPSGYVFTSVYVPEDGVAYVGGRDAATNHYGRVWKWTSAGGFVEQFNVFLNGTFDAGFLLHGSGPSDIWACACFPDQVAYSPALLYHYNGSAWSSSVLSLRIPFSVSASLTYGNGLDNSGGSGGDLYKHDGSWSSVDSDASAQAAYSIAATADVVFAGVYSSGHKVVWSQGEGALASCTSLGGSSFCRSISIDPDNNDNVIVVGGTNSNSGTALYRESSDGGTTWGSVTTLTGYQLACGVFYATDWASAAINNKGASLVGLSLEYVAKDGLGHIGSDRSS